MVSMLLGAHRCYSYENDTRRKRIKGRSGYVCMHVPIIEFAYVIMHDKPPEARGYAAKLIVLLCEREHSACTIALQ